MQATTFEVRGMTCPSCVRHIDHALRRIATVTRVEVRLRDGVVVVEHAAPIDALLGALRDAGYDATPRS